MANVIIDGVEYAPIQKASGNRAVIVVDRGWIFAGDVTRENGRIKLSNALHIWRWEGIGISGLIENPASSKVTMKPCADVDIPAGAEIFCIPVSDKWGLK